jgi:hypothetical protein
MTWFKLFFEETVYKPHHCIKTSQCQHYSMRSICTCTHTRTHHTHTHTSGCYRSTHPPPKLQKQYTSIQKRKCNGKTIFLLLWTCPPNLQRCSKEANWMPNKLPAHHLCTRKCNNQSLKIYTPMTVPKLLRVMSITINNGKAEQTINEMEESLNCWSAVFFTTSLKERGHSNHTFSIILATLNCKFT